MIQFGDLPPSWVPDSKSLGASLNLVGGGAYLPPSAATLALLNQFPAPNTPVVITIAPPKNPATLKAPTTPAANPPTHVQSSLDTQLKTPTTTPSAAFTALLKTVYNCTDPKELAILWKRFGTEPASLSLAERVGNAVVKQIVETKRTVAGDSMARPDLLKPAATRGTVRSANGVGVRATPFGTSAGQSLANGSAVDLVPPAQGPWYHLKSGGWVAGLWINLQ